MKEDLVPKESTDARTRSEFRKKNTQEGKSPYDHAGLISKSFFLWVLPVLFFGNKMHLEQDDNYPLRKEEAVLQNYKEFKKILENFKSKGVQRNLVMKTLWCQYKWSFIGMIFLNFMDALSQYFSPLVVFCGTQLIEADELTIENGAKIGGAYALLLIFSGLLRSQVEFRYSVIMNKMKMNLVQEIYAKGLKISTSSPGFNMGQVGNLVSLDAGKLDEIGHNVAMLIETPFSVIIGITGLYFIVGVSVFCGVIVLLLSISLGLFMSSVYFKEEEKLLKKKDARIKLSEQVFSSIRFVKLYVLENFFTKKLCELRSNEVRSLKCLVLLKNISTFLVWMMSPVFMAAVLGSYALIQQPFMSSTFLFTFLSLSKSFRLFLFSYPLFFGGIGDTFIYILFFYPKVVTSFMELVVSFKRLDGFFFSEELDTSFIQHELGESPESGENAVIVKGSFSWNSKKNQKGEEEKTKRKGKVIPKKNEKEGSSCQKEGNGLIVSFLDPSGIQDSKMEALLGNDPTSNQNSKPKEPKLSEETQIEPVEESIDQLSDLDMTFSKGKLTGIFGKVGAGKSSLFDSFFGEMSPSGNESKITINGKMAYVSQKSWIQSGTVKENILFGNELQEGRYQEVIRLSCLDDDLKEFPQTDMTVIGDKGINLSGGQKARLSLARALYSDSDIYLLYFPSF